jgi:hypothetical protein
MRRLSSVLLVVLAAILLGAVLLAFSGVKYAYEPAPGKVLSRTRPSPEAYDLWGRSFTQQEAARLLKTSEGTQQLSPRNGAIRVDEALLRLGRRAFYKEPFDNEIFLSDVVCTMEVWPSERMRLPTWDCPEPSKRLNCRTLLTA